MPCDYSKYPKDWKAIRAEALERAAHKCEQCGVLNYSAGARDRFGKWHDEIDIDNMKSDDGEYLWPNGYPRIVRVVLTISHTDHDTSNNETHNLRALCERCHLAHDADLHRANARVTNKRKKGLQELF